MAKRVYLFDEGGKDDRDLLGGKGANLCEMTRLGLPVPFGLVITTPTCREYFERGNKLPTGLEAEYRSELKIVEKRMGATFGDPENPLLFSVRSGAPISMPGMMNTILNLGLNDEITAGLAKKTGNARFAYDSQRRFMQMFADVVLEVDGERYEHIIDEYKKAKGYTTDPEMTAEDWQAVIAEFKKIATIPDDPFEQLRLAIEAVFRSWHSARAKVYREMNDIPDSLGTAVTVQPMVFGNFGDTSGSGVAFTRNPATGENEFYGEFLFNAAGEDVVAGIRTPEPISALAERLPEVYQELMDTQQLLEKHYRDMQDIEFTVQEGRFFCCRRAAASARAARPSRSPWTWWAKACSTSRTRCCAYRPSTSSRSCTPWSTRTRRPRSSPRVSPRAPAAPPARSCSRPTRPWCRPRRAKQWCSCAARRRPKTSTACASCKASSRSSAA